MLPWTIKNKVSVRDVFESRDESNCNFISITVNYGDLVIQKMKKIGSTPVNKEFHHHCYNSQSPYYEPESDAGLEWKNTKERPPIRFSDGSAVNPRHHTSCLVPSDPKAFKIGMAYRRSSERPFFPRSFRSDPLLVHPELTAGEKRYLSSIARIYSADHMKRLKQYQYNQLLLNEMEKGFYTMKEYEQYRRFIDAGRRRQYLQVRAASAPPRQEKASATSKSAGLTNLVTSSGRSSVKGDKSESTKSKSESTKSDSDKKASSDASTLSDSDTVADDRILSHREGVDRPKSRLGHSPRAVQNLLILFPLSVLDDPASISHVINADNVKTVFSACVNIGLCKDRVVSYSQHILNVARRKKNKISNDRYSSPYTSQSESEKTETEKTKTTTTTSSQSKNKKQNKRSQNTNKTQDTQKHTEQNSDEQKSENKSDNGTEIIKIPSDQSNKSQDDQGDMDESRGAAAEETTKKVPEESVKEDNSKAVKDTETSANQTDANTKLDSDTKSTKHDTSDDEPTHSSLYKTDTFTSDTQTSQQKTHDKSSQENTLTSQENALTTQEATNSSQDKTPDSQQTKSDGSSQEPPQKPHNYSSSFEEYTLSTDEQTYMFTKTNQVRRKYIQFSETDRL
ncbi:hypothetical protein KUTeg_009974 [Tegillarca granosa]|uniref:Uncharacterized protein n=1 Tax=Tegillarca granosa TaxID=220873 RepID=A0ABQ9F7Q0_TEGGR|nr:hypothetical protein KUTeg_009974 [Tegillarca granosa]